MRYSLFLKHDVWIHFYVGHVDGFALFDDVTMLANHQPSDVREKETTRSVVRVGVGVAVLVMLPVISDPNVQTVLGCENIRNSADYDVDV
jgi:hypothetical protein